MEWERFGLGAHISLEMALKQRGSRLIRRVAVLGVVALLGVVGMAGGEARDADTAEVELRVLQSVHDDGFILVNAFAVGTSWDPQESSHVALNGGFSSTGRFRYGDTAVEVALPNGAHAMVEARVWQDVENGRTIFISARPANGSWKIVGTPRLPLDHEFEDVRYGAIRLRVPVPGSNAAEVCSAGVAVPDPEDNPGLVRDCEALFRAGPVLAGPTGPWGAKALTNWTADVAVSEWAGVTVSGAPARVTELAVPRRWSGGDNTLRGRIPPELGLLSKLEVLDLSAHHELTGEIPGELGNLSSLKTLDLSENWLTGEIPRELGDLANLEFLRLEDNRLTGSIPRELGQLAKLRQLRMGSWPSTGNQLTGAIPPELGQLASLELLSLSKNLLEGPIPPSLGSLANLSSLDLSENQLSGAIPRELGRLSNLTRLDLSQNALTGTIPPELGDLASLSGLYLHDNQLTGPIPPELGSVGGLTRLVLSDNQLTGGIPREFGQLTELELLHLRNNRLTGEIPAELASAKFHSDWAGLWIGGNRWEGCIPLALRPFLEETDYTRISDLQSLGLNYCQCLPPPEETPAPELAVGVDDIPYLGQDDETGVAGTYRLSFNLVIDLPAGGVFRLGERYPARSGNIYVSIFETRTASILTIDPFTGYEYSRSVIDGPADCEANPSRLFDAIVASARVQPPHATPAPEDIQEIERREYLEGGATYWLNRAAHFLFEVPQGWRFRLSDIGECANPGRCYWWMELIDEDTGSTLLLDIDSGEVPSWGRDVTEAGVERGVDETFDAIAASVRQYPPPPSCDRPETAPDCAILIEARDTLAGDGELNWSEDIPVGHWWGVTVDRWTGRVTEVHPASRELTGQIPAVLSELSALRLLWLGPNSRLTGEIPPELAQLTELETLYLAMNRLSGGIPAELGQLSRLETLNLEGNSLTGEIPPEIAALPTLRLLQIDGNQLEGCLPKPFWFMSIKMGWAESNPDLRRCKEDE